ncbi:SET domain-containing protein [Coprinellus micaceus]|uniref:SET domain-containing protein n=1 Tax=Coprinellus micaceus TaxID=71717 RepID=A0A4Y7TW56_COPMI|nr:SET domain-containing protein [Coprinellus micaceus]
MNLADKIGVLLEWCYANGLEIDKRLSLRGDEQGGIAVFSGEASIPAGETAVTIPKTSALSTRSCSLSQFITPALAGPEAQLALSTALYTEILLDSSSKWYGYLLSFPETIDLPLCWKPCIEGIGRPSYVTSEELRDMEDALSWLKGTEAEKILRANTQSGLSFNRLHSYFESVVLPLVSTHMPGYDVDLDKFIRAYCLISSRAFLVDSFHGLAMVPIADAFNHIQENHVHLESDYNVCPECGSLDECSHDREGGDHATEVTTASLATSGHVYDCYEMVTNTAIPPFGEVYNTYGETLSNAELLCQYGFVLEANENDALTWMVDEVLDAAGISLKSRRASIIQRCSEYLKEFDFDDTQCLIQNTDPKKHRQYSINADGQASIQLWILLVTISTQKATADARGMLPLLHELQIALEHQSGGSESDSESEDNIACDSAGDHDSMVGALVRSIGDGCFGILESTYRLLVELCRVRKGSIGKGVQGADDLWDVLATLGTHQRRTRSALLLAMNERLILSSCEATWQDLLGVLERSRTSSRN